MSKLRYFYSILPGSIVLRPYVPAVAINLLNGKSSEFVAVLDTGADKTTLSDEILEKLEIDISSLPVSPVWGIQEAVPLPVCDFIAIGLVEFRTGLQHFPNDQKPVPAYFAPRPSNLLGRDSFLNLCRTCFDGPNQFAELEF